MAKLKGAEKRAFLAKMASGRRKGGGRRRHGRRRNPILGVNVKPMVRSGLGIAAGAYVGNMIASLVGQHLISRLPTGIVQAIGYAAGGVGELILGEWLGRKVKAVPVPEIAQGASVSMFVRAFQALGLYPLGLDVPAEAPVESLPAETPSGYFPRRRRPRLVRGMRGGFIGQSLPGGMAGTMQPLPSAMSGFQGLLS